MCLVPKAMFFAMLLKVFGRSLHNHQYASGQTQRIWREDLALLYLGPLGVCHGHSCT